MALVGGMRKDTAQISRLSGLDPFGDWSGGEAPTKCTVHDLFFSQGQTKLWARVLRRFRPYTKVRPYTMAIEERLTLPGWRLKGRFSGRVLPNLFTQTLRRNIRRSVRSGPRLWTRIHGEGLTKHTALSYLG